MFHRGPQSECPSPKPNDESNLAGLFTCEKGTRTNEFMTGNYSSCRKVELNAPFQKSYDDDNSDCTSTSNNSGDTS